LVKNVNKHQGKRLITERNDKWAAYAVTSLDTLFQAFYDAELAEGVSDRSLELCCENFKYLCNYLMVNGIPLELNELIP
jgi:molybdopterin-guanine dinucleotide biosynthesis protein